MNNYKPPKWPLWKRELKLVLDMFEMGDHEYYRGTIGRFPYTVSLTILEPARRTGWRRLMPYRIRLSVAHLIRQRVWSRCTKCGSAFGWRELMARPQKLQFFQSGSICHMDCEPTEEFKAMCRRLSLSHRAVQPW